MRMPNHLRQKQRGAALLIVLLLAATLSFVALASTNLIGLAAKRTVNVNARGEALWRGFAAETLALAAIEQAIASSDGKMSLDDPWASEIFEFPFDNGLARLRLVDATTCFDPNTLAGQSDDRSESDTSAAIFSRLANNAGFSSFEAESVREAITDWIDADGNRRPQGAEDEYYTALPSPYRAGNQPIASVSELRAVKGMTRDTFRRMKPFLCHVITTEASKVNVNMLRTHHAPLLAAMLGEAVSVQAAEDIIAARPPGGYTELSAFLAEPAIAALSLDGGAQSRLDVTSQNIQVYAEIIYDTAVLEMTSNVTLNGGTATVLSRRIGAEE